MLRKIRLHTIALIATLLALPLGCSFLMPAETPIVFVHGNGDTAAVWYTTMWRFEANEYPRDYLFAIDFTYPNSRAIDDVPQEGRSSTTDQMNQLSEFVDDVMDETGKDKVILIGSSRGGNAIRNYIKNGGGAVKVSRAILCGVPNHGTVALDSMMIGSEFNGTQPFLKGLNDGSEVVGGVKFMTIRSNRLDKYAQPDGAALGFPGVPTGVGYDSPALEGAENIVAPMLDHREVAFHGLAFLHMYEFITGVKPNRFDAIPEEEPELNGKINGMMGTIPTNIGLQGAQVEIYEVSEETGEREGEAKHTQTTGEDGLWGPITADPDAYYEFVITVAGHPITHIYRSPFPRSSEVIHLRPGLFAEGHAAAGSIVMMRRPRGYFGQDRDTFTLDDQVPEDVRKGIPVDSTSKLKLDPAPTRAVKAVLGYETITVQSWPAQENHLVIAEFHY
jgi:triacylglycerol lipase